MSWAYILAACGEARFFGRHYGGESYWRALRVDPDWLAMFNMGGEL